MSACCVQCFTYFHLQGRRLLWALPICRQTACNRHELAYLQYCLLLGIFLHISFVCKKHFCCTSTHILAFLIVLTYQIPVNLLWFNVPIARLVRWGGGLGTEDRSLSWFTYKNKVLPFQIIHQPPGWWPQLFHPLNLKCSLIYGLAGVHFGCWMLIVSVPMWLFK